MSESEWSPDWGNDISDVDEQSAIPSFETLPFSEIHGTPKDVMDKLQAFAEPYGFSLVKRRTKAHNPPRPDAKIGTMVIRCSKGNKIQPPKGMKRKRPSKMTECPFRLTARENRAVWTLKLNCGNHNHPPLHATAHISHRKRAMTAEKVERIRHASENGIKPRELLNEFRAESPDCILQINDIYNKKSQLRAAQQEKLKQP